LSEIEIQGVSVSESDASWANVATRVIRVALARWDHGYAELVDALASVGIEENERSLINRVSRGTVRFTLLLQIMRIADEEVPPKSKNLGRCKLKLCWRPSLLVSRG
jgi:hypothetical protein